VYTGKIRTIIYDPRFEQDLARIIPSVRRADEFLEGAEQVLSRTPEQGYQLEDSNVWFVAGHTVDVALYYTFDADNVYLLSIEKVEPPEF
jgi:hypothetical protein